MKLNLEGVINNQTMKEDHQGLVGSGDCRRRAVDYKLSSFSSNENRDKQTKAE